MRIQRRTILHINILLLVLLTTGSALAGSGSQPEARQKEFRSGPAAEMLALINQARAEARTCGDKEFPSATPLQWNDKLATAALKHAEDMVRRDYFSHKSKSGSTMSDRVRREHYDYRAIGENIAFTMDVRKGVELWLNSPGHCANLMNAEFTEMGGAFAVSGKQAWKPRWVQVLGTRR